MYMLLVLLKDYKILFFHNVNFSQLTKFSTMLISLNYQLPLACLNVNLSQSAPLQIDFEDTSNKRVDFVVNCAEFPSGFTASIAPSIGELLRPREMGAGDFAKLRGLFFTKIHPLKCILTYIEYSVFSLYTTYIYISVFVLIYLFNRH